MQVAAVGGEIVAAVSDRQSIAPEADRLYPAVSWLIEPNASVFQLRALALSRCSGEIVAVTEDHAWTNPDWCQGILDAHTQYPDAAAIGGIVENGATGSIKDWASFFIVQVRFMRPIHEGQSDAISLQANVSYKRRALPESLPEFGLVQSIFHRELRDRGEKFFAANRLVVYHAQKLSFGGHSASHFHNGRATAAFRRTSPLSPWLRPVRVLGCLALAPVKLLQTLTVGLGKRRHTRELLMGLPLLVWLICCHTVGELIGYLAGPGNSAQGVH
jgi:hypothetical protein